MPILLINICFILLIFYSHSDILKQWKRYMSKVSNVPKEVMLMIFTNMYS